MPAITGVMQDPRRGSVIVWVLGGLVVIAAGAYAATRYFGDSAPAEVSQNDLFTARKTSFDIIVPASGELEALNQIEIRNQLDRSTKIKSIVEEGKSVKAGDILVELNSDQIESEITQEKLQVEAATNDVDAAVQAVELQKSENESAERAANLKVELAELEMDRWEKGEVITKRRDLAVALETATKNLERCNRDYKESVVLREREFISESEKEADEIRLTQAENDLDKAQRAITVYNDFEYKKDLKTKTSDVEEAKAARDRALSQNARNLDRRNNDLDAKKKQLELRQENLQKLEEQLSFCTIKAPNDGLVVYQTSLGGGRFFMVNQSPMQVGRDVYPNESLIVLPDTSQIVASVKVHESLSSLIQPEMRATVKIDAKQDLSLPAKVRTISVLAEQNWMSESREYTIKLLIDQPNTWDLKPSMRCKAEIQLGRADGALAVPVQAVFAEKGVYYVWKPAGGKFVRQIVQTGRSSETLTEITEGLSEGDVVLLREPLAGEKGTDEFDTKMAEVAKDREKKRMEAMAKGVGQPQSNTGNAQQVESPVAPDADVPAADPQNEAPESADSQEATEPVPADSSVPAKEGSPPSEGG